MGYKKKDEDKHGDANGKSDDIDDRINLIFEQASKSHSEIITKHCICYSNGFPLVSRY